MPVSTEGDIIDGQAELRTSLGGFVQLVNIISADVHISTEIEAQAHLRSSRIDKDLSYALT